MSGFERSEELTKRIVDWLLAIPLCICLCPLFLITAILIKKEDGGSIFYLGTRVGKYGKPFKIFKFRTMVMNAESMGGPASPEDDPRVTRIGKFMRRYKLDELPQLVNIIRGEMSIVGPRPEVASEVATYNQEEKKILSVRPGITDWASIKFRNEGKLLKGKNNPQEIYRTVIKPEKLRLELTYVEKKSFLADMQILLSTIYALIKDTF